MHLDSDDSLADNLQADSIEYVSLEEFEMIKKELQEQKISDFNFDRIKKNKRYDNELNIDEDRRIFEITEDYVTNLLYASDIASAYAWYIQQLKEILRLFKLNFKLVYQNEVIATKEQFSNKFLKHIYNFESMEKEIEKFDSRRKIQACKFVT